MALRRKAVVIIQDGLGDRLIPELGNQTPLQAAVTPLLDRIAAEGICGLVDPIAPGVRAGTDVAHLALFGLDPYRHYTGRGPIEAAGLNMELAAGDVAFRANFATVDDSLIVLDRRAGRIREGTAELAAALDGLILEEQSGEPVRVLFRPATEHRAVFILRGSNLSDRVTDSDPHAAHEMEAVQEVKPVDETDPRAIRTARLLNQFTLRAHQILEEHPVNLKRFKNRLMPANAVIFRGGGMVPPIERTTDKYGIRGACVAAETTIHGVARLAGFSVYMENGMTANTDTDLNVKAALCLKALADHDLVYVHIKGADLCGHDNRPLEKIKIIEKADEMAGKILKEIGPEVYLALAADHSTPCEVRDHSGDPVPAAIYGPSVRIDPVKHYDELSCAGGGLGRITGSQFFLTLVDLMGFTPKYGS